MGRPVATKISAHIASALLAGAFATALRRHYAAWEGDLSGITADQLVLGVAIPALIFAAIFGFGHYFLRYRSQNARLVYSLLGVVALLTATAVVMPAELYSAAAEDGVISIFIGMTALVGSLIGFLHVRSAGRVHDEDEIAQVEAATAPKEGSAETPENARLGLVETGSDGFFDGPLQVVSSWSAAVTAALVGGIAHTFYTGFVMLAFSDGFGGRNSRLAEQFMSGEILSSIVFGLVFSILICLFFLPPAVFGLNKLLTSRGWTKMSTYLIAGAVAPLAVGLMMLGIGIFVTHWFILPLCVAMGIYRHLAGLEPASLPEDIEVRDRRTLVGEDHVRRRLHRISG